MGGHPHIEKTGIRYPRSLLSDTVQLSRVRYQFRRHCECRMVSGNCLKARLDPSPESESQLRFTCLDATVTMSTYRCHRIDDGDIDGVHVAALLIA